MSLIRAVKNLASALLRLSADLRENSQLLRRNEEVMKQAVTDINAAFDEYKGEVDSRMAQYQATVDGEMTRISELGKQLADAQAGADDSDLQASIQRIKDATVNLRSQVQQVTPPAVQPSQSGQANLPQTPLVDTPLAGVPSTPPGPDTAATGAAVPNTDHVITDTSVNVDTSGPASENPGADAAAAAGQPVDPKLTDEVASGQVTTTQPSQAAQETGASTAAPVPDPSLSVSTGATLGDVTNDDGSVSHSDGTKTLADGTRVDGSGVPISTNN